MFGVPATFSDLTNLMFCVLQREGDAAPVLPAAEGERAEPPPPVQPGQVLPAGGIRPAGRPWELHPGETSAGLLQPLTLLPTLGKYYTAG